ncbi:hypothetical protein [Parasulfitobacter algicola]|uniref:Uncharacterized protein n=1 Tax=Parasulfitobacter algicola TaxID=2614809 RepID=A0ABX2IWJ0_9RHOB|nr:hypothetical protein [Sulfitobacter algicola]NSX55282.1 hypothetical protein [Sulfitobacter algicola]
MAQVDIKVIVDIKGGTDPEDVSRSAAQMGMQVERVIPMIGAIYGSCDADNICKLEELKGVLRVAPESHVQLPPISPKIPQ